MGGSQKSKGVTWASDEYLCQVKLFLSEEPPSQVASSAQGHLQVKTSWASVSDGMLSDENMPPGFEGPQSANTWIVNLSQIPVIKWKFPPKYVFDIKWKVVAGEESKEVEAQKKREMGNLEAIYPKPSDIPSDPPMLAGAEIAFHDDQECPIIPVIPIEDEDVEAEMKNDSTALNTVTMSLQPQRTAPGTSSFDPDVLAAAQSALSVLMRNNDQGNLIDHELLIKVLSDPKLIEQLSRNPGAQSIVQNLSAMNGQRMAPPSATQVLHMPNMINNRLGATSPAVRLPASPSSYPMSRPEFVAPAPGGGFYPPANRSMLPPNVRPLAHESVPSPNAPPVTKDINYYKNLIQQHGGERHDLTPHSGVQSNQHLSATSTSNFRPPPRDLKQKIMKPCMYFNTSRGCRNGANCAFQHEGSNQQRVNNSNQDSQNAKRMKMEREITGT